MLETPLVIFKATAPSGLHNSAAQGIIAHNTCVSRTPQGHQRNVMFGVLQHALGDSPMFRMQARVGTVPTDRLHASPTLSLTRPATQGRRGLDEKYACQLGAWAYVGVDVREYQLQQFRTG